MGSSTRSSTLLFICDWRGVEFWKKKPRLWHKATNRCQERTLSCSREMNGFKRMAFPFPLVSTTMNPSATPLKRTGSQNSPVLHTHQWTSRPWLLPRCLNKHLRRIRPLLLLFNPNHIVLLCCRNNSPTMQGPVHDKSKTAMGGLPWHFITYVWRDLPQARHTQVPLSTYLDPSQTPLNTTGPLQNMCVSQDYGSVLGEHGALSSNVGFRLAI